MQNGDNNWNVITAGTTAYEIDSSKLCTSGALILLTFGSQLNHIFGVKGVHCVMWFSLENQPSFQPLLRSTSQWWLVQDGFTLVRNILSPYWNYSGVIMLCNSCSNESSTKNVEQKAVGLIEEIKMKTDEVKYFYEMFSIKHIVFLFCFSCTTYL